MASIQPSRALVMRADATIRECIEKMQNSDVGSVLIVEDTTPSRLIGIFTERDLLKNVGLIQEGDFWDRPIRTVMTQPVVTLDVEELDRASEVMAMHPFRHLAITQGPHQGLVGIVSMRDLFRWLQRKQNSGATNAAQEGREGPLRAVVMSKDAGVQSFIRQSLKFFQNSHLKVLEENDQIVDPSAFLVVDLDELDPSFWSKLLKAKHHEVGVKQILVVFDSLKQPRETLELLETLAISDKFTVIAKPLDFFSVHEALRKVEDGLKEEKS